MRKENKFSRAPNTTQDDESYNMVFNHVDPECLAVPQINFHDRKWKYFRKIRVTANQLLDRFSEAMIILLVKYTTEFDETEHIHQFP